MSLRLKDSVSGNLSGNASTATTLQTARTINGTSFNGSANITTANWGTARTLTIGNTGKSVNGSANVSWTLAEIGAAASSHTHDKIVSRGNVTAESGITARPAVDGLSMSQAYNNGYPTSYGNVISLRGAGDGQILVGWSGTDGAHAPVYVRSKRDNTSTANWSGWAQFYTSANPQTSVSGNAGTATTLQTARTLTIGNTGKSFNGSANVSWSLSEIGAAASSHTHSSITGISTASVTPSTGTGVMRYDYNVSSSVAGNMPVTNNANGIITLNTHSGNYYSQLGFSSNGNLYYRNFSNTALNTTQAWKQIAFTTSNVSTATTLQTARTLTIGNTGKSFNGSANVSWSLSEIGAAASSHTHNYAGSSSAGGAATSALTCTGNSATATKLYTSRTINGTSFNGSANITTANWGTARNITIGNSTKSVNGSANVSWSLSEIGVPELIKVEVSTCSSSYLDFVLPSGVDLMNYGVMGFIGTQFSFSSSGPSYITGPIVGYDYNSMQFDSSSNVLSIYLTDYIQYMTAFAILIKLR